MREPYVLRSARIRALRFIKSKTKKGKKGVIAIYAPETAPCPICVDGGRVNSKLQGQDDCCPLCLGRGFVVLAACTHCGRPAFFFKSNVRYCGRKECFIAQTQEARKVGSKAKNVTARKGWDDEAWTTFQEYPQRGPQGHWSYEEGRWIPGDVSRLGEKREN